MKKVGRPPLVSDEMLTKIKLKSVLNNLCISRAAITQNVVIGVRNDVHCPHCPEKVSKLCSRITLSTKWTWNVLKLLDWVKHRRTTAKKEMNPALYEELTFSWKRKESGNNF